MSSRLVTPGLSGERRTAAGAGVGVGDRPRHLAAYDVGRVEQVDRAGRVGGLRHLAVGVQQVHHPGGAVGGGDHLGHGEDLAVAPVEPQREVAGQLDVLALVGADRHLRGAVEQDVGRHQGGIGEQRDPGGVDAAALLLELDHPVQLAGGGDALEQVGQLGVRRHLALPEQGGPVEADGEEAAWPSRRRTRAAGRGRARWSSRAGRRRRRRRPPGGCGIGSQRAEVAAEGEPTRRG